MYLFFREDQPPLRSRPHDACHPSVGSLGSIAGRAGRFLSAYGNSLILRRPRPLELSPQSGNLTRERRYLRQKIGF